MMTRQFVERGPERGLLSSISIALGSVQRCHRDMFGIKNEHG